MNFLADKKVNTGRQKELDIAKALAIIFMIFCHVIVFASFSNISITLGFEMILNQTAAIIAAPVFMFCMGIGLFSQDIINITISLKKAWNYCCLDIL